MKTSWLLLIACGMVTLSAYAENTMGSAPNKPCKNIHSACTAAGFVRGDKQGKALFKDCIKPILQGQSVAGATVSPDDVNACKAKLQTFKENQTK